jgi:hypothetical protein
MIALILAAQMWSVSGDTAAVLGEEARVVYRATVPPGTALKPDALASGTSDFAVVKAESEKDGSWAWTILPLNAGRLAFTAHWTAGGEAAEAPAVQLFVREPDLPSDADIADIKAPASARPALWPWLLAAALGALAWEGWRRWKARAAANGAFPPAAPPPVSPETAAEEALAELARAGLWERGEHAAFYLRLGEIVRAYLEARYGENATAMTSAELARLLRRRERELRASALVRELFERGDLVKFARVPPGAQDGPKDAALALELVRATTPRPAPEEARA